MALSPHVLDATAENFQRLVLENSRRGLVLVHFWTPKAGPCMVLMPRLVKLATEYGGRFLLVMLNTDELGRIAREFGVNSVPTVKFFRNGTVVNTIHGAESDNSFREQLNRFIARDTETLHVQGLAAWKQNRIDEARSMLASAAVEEPDNPQIPRDLARLLWSRGEHKQALQLLESLPSELREQKELSQLYAHFSLVHAAETAFADKDIKEIDPNDPQLRFQQASLELANDQIETALELLIALDHDHPQYRNGLPRQALLALFDMLGAGHHLTQAYRSRLAQG